MNQKLLIFGFLACLIMGQLAASAQEDPSLVGFWQFDDVNELSVYPVLDSTEWGHHGMLLGEAAIRTEGVSGGCLDLNANGRVGDHVEVPHAHALNVTNQLTLATWIKVFELAALNGVVTKGIELAPWSLSLSGDGQLIFEVNHWINGSHDYVNSQDVTGHERLTSHHQIPLDDWVHVAVTYDGATLTFYVQGIAERVTDRTYVFGTTTEPLIVGMNFLAGQHFLNGCMDELRIHNRALSEQEIKQLASRGLRAIDPAPENGAMDVAAGELQWWAPISFANQILSVGIRPDQLEFVAVLTNQQQTYMLTDPLPSTTYYWRVDQLISERVEERILIGDVWHFSTAPPGPSQPAPRHNALSVPMEQTTLTWAPGLGAQSHRVYFGPDRDHLDLLGIVEEPGVVPKVDYERTYVWRVDDVLANGQVITGPLWNFTVSPYVPTDPDLVAWYRFDEGGGRTSYDWSRHGLDALLVGPVAWSQESHWGWAAYGKGDGYIELPVGEALLGVHDVTVTGWFLQEMPTRWARLWSLGRDEGPYICLQPNQALASAFQYESRGVSGDVPLESGQGDHPFPVGEWTHSAVRLDMTGARASVFENGQKVLDVDDIRIDPAFLHYHGGMPTCYLGRSHNDQDALFRGYIDDFRIYKQALSEAMILRVMDGDMLKAWAPEPMLGQVVDQEKTLTAAWEPGMEAVAHRIYWGTDPQALPYHGESSDPQFVVKEGLIQGTTYYWRVDEVMGNGVIRRGDLWHFQASAYVVIDDMETYSDDQGNEIWMTWADGWNNDTGSTVGYLEPSYMERSSVHGGSQSMPFYYDNTGTYGLHSEAFMEFSRFQNWTRKQVKALTLHFFGLTSNTVQAGDQLYVGIADRQGNEAFVTYEQTQACLRQKQWHEWNVALTAFEGVNLQQVKKLTVGIGSRTRPQRGGKGLIFIDDIVLWPARCLGATGGADLNGDCHVDHLDLARMMENWLVSGAMQMPDDPGFDQLAAYWPFDGNAVDQISLQAGFVLGLNTVSGVQGEALEFRFEGDHVDLGYRAIGNLVSSLQSFTMSLWTKPTLTGGSWQRFFDFGNGTSDYMMLAAFEGLASQGGAPQFQMRVDNQLQSVPASVALIPSEWQHVAVRLDARQQRASIWIDSVKTGEAPMTYTPRDLGRTYQNYIGKSQWDDGTYQGVLDELRFYRRALTDDEIRYLAGFTQPYSDLGDAALSDVNGDGLVNSVDFAILANAWQENSFWPEP